MEAFLEVHAGDASLWEMEGTAAATATSTAVPSSERGRAAFLLQVALRALAGGNVPSAAARLALCRHCLDADLAAATAPEAPGSPAAHAAAAAAMRNKFGAVCGCQGDAARAQGDATAALAFYEESAGQLRAAAPDSEDAAQALSVTLNKIAEVHHAGGNVAAALPLYEESLALRRARYAEHQGRGSGGGGGGGGSGAEAGSATAALAAALDVAVGEAKVADALQTLGDAPRAAEHLSAARAVLEAAAAGGPAGMPPPLQQRFDAVAAHLAAQASR